jgi:hypothetical protein
LCHDAQGRDHGRLLDATGLIIMTREPGIALTLEEVSVDSGFRYAPVASFPELALSPEARQTVIDKAECVSAMLREAAEIGVGTYVQ